MKIPVSLNETMILSPGGANYEGPVSLVQFTVESTEMVLKSPKYLTVEITLKRMFQYHLAATFLPTILLVIVTEITLFVDEKHFEVTVMIHLTTMLVMYTLYQGLQSIMPKTAYLKFIDIFLLYGLIVPFITFTVEVVSKLLGGKEASNENEKEEEDKIFQKAIYTPPGSKNVFTETHLTMKVEKKGEIPRREKIRRALEYTSEKIIPLFTAVFLGVYSYLAVYYYVKG